MARHPKVVTVYPAHPELYPDEYVPGVGIAGAELAWEDAKPLLDAGLVTSDTPDEPDEEPEPEAEAPAPESEE